MPSETSKAMNDLIRGASRRNVKTTEADEGPGQPQTVKRRATADAGAVGDPDAHQGSGRSVNEALSQAFRSRGGR